MVGAAETNGRSLAFFLFPKSRGRRMAKVKITGCYFRTEPEPNRRTSPGKEREPHLTFFGAKLLMKAEEEEEEEKRGRRQSREGV